jgi:glycerol-3-phosphate O-acyltransferase
VIGPGKWGRGNQTTKADYVNSLAKIVGKNSELHDALRRREGKHYEFLKSIFYTQWSSSFFNRIVDAYLEEKNNER